MTPQVVEADPDGGHQMGVEAIGLIAVRALDGHEHPLVALERIHELARVMSIVWLNEQYEFPAVES